MGNFPSRPYTGAGCNNGRLERKNDLDMECNRQTKGAWQLEDDAPEAKKGFLLNHLINELLPAKGDGQRWSNSDPVTQSCLV